MMLAECSPYLGVAVLCLLVLALIAAAVSLAMDLAERHVEKVRKAAAPPERWEAVFRWAGGDYKVTAPTSCGRSEFELAAKVIRDELQRGEIVCPPFGFSITRL